MPDHLSHSAKTFNHSGVAAVHDGNGIDTVLTRPPVHQPLPSFTAACRILVVRLDSLGDVLMCTPAIRAVRLAWPQAHLTLLTSASGAALKPHLPTVDEVLVREVSWMKSAPIDDRNPGEDDRALVAALQDGCFDMAVVMTTVTQSALPAALACRMAGIPLRVAYSRENPYALLTHWLQDKDVLGPGMRHEVQRQLDLIKTLGITLPSDSRLTFKVHQADRLRAQQLLADAGCNMGQPFVLVHPGASAPSRRYPPESFGLAMRPVAEAGWTCVFCGGPDERGMVAAARSAMDVASIDLSGKLDLGILGALIEAAELLVANNSGPAHIAAAVGTPLVCLYALTNPQHTPWQVSVTILSHDVPCRDCLRSICPLGHQACLRGITPQTVTDAAMVMLGHRKPTLKHLHTPTWETS